MNESNQINQSDNLSSSLGALIFIVVPTITAQKCRRALWPHQPPNGRYAQQFSDDFIQFIVINKNDYNETTTSFTRAICSFFRSLQRLVHLLFGRNKW